MLPNYFVVGALLCLVHLSVYSPCMRITFQMDVVLIYIYIYIYGFVIFVASVHPCLKKRYHNRVERVRDYLEIVKDFNELISPQSLFLHFLGPNPSNHVRKKR